MTLTRPLLTHGWLLAILVVGGVTANSAEAAPRQYYARYWVPSGGYHYKHYRYQPTIGAEYKYHHVVYYPSRPKYYYYYNPYTKKYWGRYDVGAGGYSMLAAADQAEKLADIPEKAFPKPAAMPEIPESKDGIKMLAPSDEDAPPPPPDETAQLSKEKIKELNPRLGAKDPPRETFSGWCQKENSYQCNYYCQPAPTAPTYTVHRCEYHPTQPKYVYYYNPAKEKYWGRYDLEAKGYSLLEEKDRKAKLSDIPETAFPKPGAMPPIPGSKDGAKMAKPPGVEGLERE